MFTISVIRWHVDLLWHLTTCYLQSCLTISSHSLLLDNLFTFLVDWQRVHVCCHLTIYSRFLSFDNCSRTLFDLDMFTASTVPQVFCPLTTRSCSRSFDKTFTSFAIWHHAHVLWHLTKHSHSVGWQHVHVLSFNKTFTLRRLTTCSRSLSFGSTFLFSVISRHVNILPFDNTAEQWEWNHCTT